MTKRVDYDATKAYMGEEDNLLAKYDELDEHEQGFKLGEKVDNKANFKKNLKALKDKNRSNMMEIEADGTTKVKLGGSSGGGGSRYGGGGSSSSSSSNLNKVTLSGMQQKKGAHAYAQGRVEAGKQSDIMDENELQTFFKKQNKTNKKKNKKRKQIVDEDDLDGVGVKGEVRGKYLIS
jgi:hypothetical protein